MSAPVRRRPATRASHAGTSGFPHAALRYALNLYGTVERALPDAAALVGWVSTHVVSLGLQDAQALDEELPARSRPGAPRSVSFLLSGPPGTGKSAWVRHLAAQMRLPVLQKRASDLLDCFVGGTEQNIAGAFAKARDTGAFLVFDEADSLLLDRGDAVRSWEISQVNEMLTWMEGHALPFACTTNLPDRLDRASLRRFLVKVRLDWLTPAQARLAFRRLFGLDAPAALDGLRTLAPADFTLVRRRAAVTGAEADPAALARLLAAECEGRVGGRVAVGLAVQHSTACT